MSDVTPCSLVEVYIYVCVCFADIAEEFAPSIFMIETDV
jgi:hypothetical protein